jgi:hypothetical protein
MIPGPSGRFSSQTAAGIAFAKGSTAIKQDNLESKQDRQTNPLTIMQTGMNTAGFLKSLAGGLAALLLAVAGRDANAAPSFTQKDISQVCWSVSFVGATYDSALDRTTFTYQLTALSWEKDLSHWVLEFDGGFVGATPASPVALGLDPTTGVTGLKWDGGQGKGTVATYTLTVAGHAAVGVVDYAVKGGTYFAIGQTYGPAGIMVPQTYDLSGAVYLDANGSGARNAGEPALTGVEVTLFNASGAVVATTLTDANGGYSFADLVPGSYSVVIGSTGSAGSFNDTLTRYFTGSRGPLAVNLVNADSTGNDFGFRLNTAAVIGDFDPADGDGNGVVHAGEGRTIGFWKHQCTVALTRKGKAQIDATTLLALIRAVPPLYLADPFQFTAGQEYSQALAIMEARTSDAVLLLKKQLLATELNHVAGMGLTDKALQGVLINWAEYVAANGGSLSRAEVLSAQVICDLVNNLGH